MFQVYLLSITARFMLDTKHKSVAQGKHNLQTIENMQLLHKSTSVSDTG